MHILTRRRAPRPATGKYHARRHKCAAPRGWRGVAGQDTRDQGRAAARGARQLAATHTHTHTALINDKAGGPARPQRKPPGSGAVHSARAPSSGSGGAAAPSLPSLWRGLRSLHLARRIAESRHAQTRTMSPSPRATSTARNCSFLAPHRQDAGLAAGLGPGPGSTGGRRRRWPRRGLNIHRPDRVGRGRGGRDTATRPRKKGKRGSLDLLSCHPLAWPARGLPGA